VRDPVQAQVADGGDGVEDSSPAPPREVRTLLPAWSRIPDSGPIAEVLGRRQHWLDALSHGNDGARSIGLDDLADDGRTEDRIRQGYTGRAAIELLQNAHDAMADSGVVGTARFVATPTALLVANEGQPFDEERVRSITRLGSSSKAKRRHRRHQIGYKGIGFTSVFEISDRPQILSRDVGFQFDRRAAEDLVRRALGDGLDGPVPARYFPLPIEPEELDGDEELIAALFAAGAVTVIRLPIRADVDRNAVFANVRETLVPETLLFMPTMRGISFEDGSVQVAWARNPASRSGIGKIVHLDRGDGLRLSYLVAAESVLATAELIGKLDDPLWKSVQRLNAAVAIPWSERGPRLDPPASRVHSYFPTDDQLGRPVILHADFYLDASRRRLELKGTGGEVTRAAGRAVADLAGRLAESVGRWGAPLLTTFVANGAADEAGGILGQLLEASLKERRIARRFGGGEPAKPAELRRFGLTLEPAAVRRLMTAAVRARELLDPADDHGDVGALLARLGCESLAPVEVASRLDLAGTDEPYGVILGLLWSWLETTGPYRSQVVASLRQRRVVQDEHGAWARPANLERRTDDAPELPAGLRRLEVLEPPSGAARAFVDALSIARLDPATALVRTLDALDAGAFGRTDSERVAVLELLFRIWSAHPAAFKPAQPRLGAVSVRARRAGARVARAWRRADKTYFGAEWLADRALEDLYAPLGEPEFLGEPLVPSPSDRKARRAFYEALGVASVPRRGPIGWPHAKHEAEWRDGAVRSEAWTCANGHPQSPRHVDGWMVDRLDDLLEHVREPEAAAALARGLVALGEPYGPEARVQCQNSAHGSVAPRKPVIGYQRWRLQGVPWVPVANDPAGGQLQVPSRAWYGLPARSTWLLVARARLRPNDAEALGLVTAERPGPTPVEEALEALAQANPDLSAAAAEVQSTADWLARRLERGLARADRRVSTPPLATLGAAGRRWSREPAIPNLPGLPPIPGLDLLPPGRWTGLQRAYGLRGARELVTADWRAGRRESVPHLLSIEHKVFLLALLLRRRADPEHTAARLARLSERPVAWLRLAWRMAEQRTDVADPRFVLEPRRDAKGRVVGGELIWTARLRPEPVHLAGAIAEHLDLPDDDAEIALFLTEPRRVVDQRGVTSGEIEDADRLLRSRRWFRDSRERTANAPPPPDERLDASRWEAPVEDQHAPESKAVSEKTYIDPNAVVFGPAERVVAAEPRTALVKRSAGRPQPGSASRPLARPLAPAGGEEAAAAASGKRTEETAIEIVKRFGNGLPDVVEVVDVQDDDRGWDLEFVMRDGGTIPVEVKGSSGSGPFVLTGNEWNAAREHADYVLYHVVDLTTPARTRMRVFRNLKDRLKEDHVSAAGWAVTGWRNLEPEQIPVKPAKEASSAPAATRSGEQGELSG
jgi:hypothetical protein